MLRRSGTRSSIERSRTNNLTKKKQRVHICCGCQWRCSSREKLVEHMLSSSPSTPCHKSLEKCPHCHKLWPTYESLKAHLRTDGKCKRAENIPHTVSYVKIHGNNSSSESDKTIQDDRTIRSMMSTHLGVNKQCRNTARISTIMQKEADSCESFQENEQLMNFRKNVNKSSTSVEVNVDNVLLHGKCSPKEKLVAHILLQTSFCNDDGLLQMNKSFTSLRVEFRNTTAVLSLNGDLSFLPGSESVTSDICDIDLEQFIMRYGTITVPTEVSLVQTENTEDTVTQGHGSMVFGFQVLDDFEENISDDVDDELSDDASSDNSMPLLGDGLDNNVEILDSTMLGMQQSILTARTTGLLDGCDVAGIMLFNILHKASAPKNLFDKILKWAEFNQGNLENTSLIRKRNTFLKNISNSALGSYYSKISAPIQTDLSLPSKREITVTTFSLRSAIVSILMDPNIVNSTNLLIDPECKHGCPERTGNLDDINSGWWHKETQAEICCSDNHILLPVILFIDGATIDKMGKLQVEPISFTLGILNRETRKRAEAWRTLGYIEDFDNVLTTNEDELKTKKVPSSTKLQDYHAIIDHILRDFHDLQGKHGGFKWKLNWKNRVYEVVFKIAVQVVIGDCKGNDSLCGRYGSHSLQVKRLCRDCKVLTTEGDDTMHVCRWIKKTDLQGATKQQAQDLSFHHINNAFNDIYMGSRNLGITECTPPEPLHGFKMGLCKYLYEEFSKAIAPKTLRLVSATVKTFSNHCFGQSVKDLPSLSPFRNGIDVSHCLTAKETYARIFAIHVAMMDPKVMESLATEETYIRVDDENTGKMRFARNGSLGLRTAIKWFRLVQDTVLFDGWLMQPKHNLASVTPRNIPENPDEDFVLTIHHDSPAQSRIRRYLTDYKSLVERTHGNGLKIPKFHQNLHYTEQILKDGSLLNIDGGRPESHNKSIIKQPAKTTQKNQKNITSQIARNYHESLVLRSSTEMMKKSSLRNDAEEEEGEDLDSLYKGSQFELRFDCEEYSDTESYSIEIKWKGTRVKDSLNSHLCKCVAGRLFVHKGEGGCLHKDSVVKGYTEFNHQGTTYRAHPCFRGVKSWHDWAMIKWNDMDEGIPARILMFLDISDCNLMSPEEHRDMCEELEEDNEFSDDVNHAYYYLTNEKWIIVQSAISESEIPNDFEDDSPYRMFSLLSKRFYLEDGLRILPASSITGPAYCVTNPSTKDGSKLNNSPEVTRVCKKQGWGKIFLL